MQHSRLSRNDFYRNVPHLVDSLLALEKISDSDNISVSLKHLIKLRVSQINGCCFCQHMHAGEARKDGEYQQRLDILLSWHEAPAYFTDKEQAALNWAESLTRIPSQSVIEQHYQAVIALFGEKGVAELTAIILSINSWNRVAISMGFTPDVTLG
ncbi:carboxymuconolactone decarboxylase family protein [Neptunicella marina]|uniref:Carboxymuconolactone decarboxylase family protein n=1 Tax=Neptunicella marina TaxID=2125989 RepID=A0A8J6IWY9_9ALTE|nr:carboxymuconolactone decarboxylase family protein [Neptunicella marina]MBC3767085.1 carboxymuconolactone decarboxylase family protein [Neptunicella marina]